MTTDSIDEGTTLAEVGLVPKGHVKDNIKRPNKMQNPSAFKRLLGKHGERLAGSDSIIPSGIKRRNMDEMILTKAKELFFSYGLKSVSMDDLAKMAGVSKKTIYQFFTDKNELVSRIVDDLMACHHKLVHGCQCEAKDAVKEVLMQSNKPFNTWASVNQAFFFELEKSFPEAWTKLEQYKQKVLFPGITKNLERGIGENLYRQDIDVAFTADVRIQQLSSALQPATFTGRKMNGSQLLNELTIFYLHGITTEKGKGLLNKYLNKTHWTNESLE
jgi:AcrR family transcriptional regulator